MNRNVLSLSCVVNWISLYSNNLIFWNILWTRKKFIGIQIITFKLIPKWKKFHKNKQNKLKDLIKNDASCKRIFSYWMQEQFDASKELHSSFVKISYEFFSWSCRRNLEASNPMPKETRKTWEERIRIEIEILWVRIRFSWESGTYCSIRRGI